MKILECSSRGDRRFSAFGACITINGRTDCIENFYQAAKRTVDDQPVGKGKPFHHFVCPFCGITFPPEDISDFYRGLWIIYFKQHPELLDYAATFDEFHDMFKGKAVNCQADVVRGIVRNKDGFISQVKQGHWYQTMRKTITGQG